MSEQPAPIGTTEDDYVLAERYRIDPAQPLPMLNSPHARAVVATDMREAGRPLFALMCRADLLPRIDVIPTLRRLDSLSMVSPVDAGPVPWPETGGRRFVIVLEPPMGERVLDSLDARFEPWREDTVVDAVITPLAPLMREFASRQLKNRAIRADNLFYADATRSTVMFGECVSAPPGLSQPVLYEPIDAAIARPSGRGPGLVSDDLYALGALLVVLLTGGNPLAGRSDEEIIDMKICLGSCAALVGENRISLNLMEPLRGLLCDDPKERWTVDDLTLWLGGRHLTPKQALLPAKAARSIHFAGYDHWNRTALAHRMGRHWKDANKLVSSGELANWLKRSLSDDESANALSALSQFGADSTTAADDMVSRSLMVTDPALPLRFKAFSARLDGILQSFAIEFNDLKMREAFIQVMRAKLPQTLLQSQRSSRSEHASLMKMFDAVNTFLSRKQFGSGIERILYECNPSWPCQSALIREHYVCDVEDLLPALELVAQRGPPDGEPIDAHIAGLCAARYKTQFDPILRNLNARDNVPAFRLGILQLLGEVHRRTDPEARYPALSLWVSGLLTPVVNTYHNRAKRAALATEVERVGANGNLGELLSLVDDPDAQSADAQGFRAATTEFANLVRGLAWLQAGGLTSDSHVRNKSQQAATFVSATLSGLIIVAVAVIHLV